MIKFQISVKSRISLPLFLFLLIPIISCSTTADFKEDKKISEQSTLKLENIKEEEVIPVNYRFHDSIEILPKGIYGTAGFNATYVYFGDWPQTIKAENIIINENESEIHGAFTYYKGSDGYWYAKCIERKFVNGDKPLTYSDGSLVTDTVKYFKVEPIKWCILTENYNDSNNALLLSEQILYAEDFDSDSIFYVKDSDYNSYYSTYLFRKINGKEIYPTNYKESRIRAYLNGISYTIFDKSKEEPTQILNNEYENKGFLQTAFSVDAQSLIKVSTIDNSYVSNIHYPCERIYPWNTGRDDYWCEDTYDKVFLLSEKEITSGDFKFGTLSEYSIRNVKFIDTTDFAKANNAYEFFFEDKFVTFWWTRTPMNGDWRISRFVEYQGCSADNMGGGRCGGIVPAICVSLDESCYSNETN